MSWMWAVAASFLGAVISALGMGGGGILLIYLTVYLGMSQLEAQGINLVFFLPVAAVALCIHAKNKLICWRVVLPFVALGLPGVWLGVQIAQQVGSERLSKLFGYFLLIIGLRELLARKPRENQS